MKKLTVYLMLFLSFQVFSLQAIAGLISVQSDKSSYINGETISIDFIIDNTSLTIAEVDFNFVYNDSVASFEQFTFTSDVDVNALVADTVLTNANLLDDLSTLNIYTLWFDSLDVQPGVFTLGSASFKATSPVDFNSQNFELVSQFVGDAFGDQLVQTVTVPEPASIALFGFALIALYRKSKKHSL